MFLRLAKTYAHLYALVKEHAGWNLKGLGWLLNHVTDDAVIESDGVRFFFDHRIAGSYVTMIAGYCNEPETPAFIAATLEKLGGNAVVVDVGASVGDIALRAATYARVSRVLAFEAHPVAASALRRSITLNGWSHVQVFEELVGDGAAYPFEPSDINSSASGIVAGSNGPLMQSMRLDERLADVTGPLIMVIDVEGAEPIVLRGAAQTIARLKPVIIFEYNDVSRRRYALSEVRALLGDGYEIYRLTRAGQLDDDCEHAWNCVALPRPN